MNYHNITTADMMNGEGLRAVLWLSGCSHHCYNCQNTQTWNANSGILFDKAAKEELFRELDKDYISGMTLSGGDPLFDENLDEVLDLVTEVNKRYNIPQYIDNINDNNHNILNYNANKFRLSLPRKSIWLYTGYTWEDIFGEKSYVVNELYNKRLNDIHSTIKRRKIVKQCDVLVDGKYIDSQRDISLPWRGSSNQKVINLQQSLQKGEIVLWQT